MEWMILPLKRYAEFSGRSRRMEYWLYTLGVCLLFLLMMIVAMVIGFSAVGVASARGGAAGLGGMVGLFASMGIMAIVMGFIWLGLLIPTIAVAIRRLHDTDRSGWWLMIYVGPYLLSMVLNVVAVSANSSAVGAIGGLTSFVGLIGAVVLLVFYCLQGTAGPNRYGPDPLGSTANLAETFR